MGLCESSERKDTTGMSWQAYVDDNLVKSGMVKAAGIYDLNGNPWAYSAGFAAQVAEVGTVSAAMAKDPLSLAQTGVTIAGVKYLFVRGDPDCVIAKKARRFHGHVPPRLPLRA